LTSVIVPLRSRRRERAVIAQKVQHAAPAVVLFGAGITALREGPQGAELLLAIVEIVSSALLMGSFAQAIRKARRPANAAEHPHHHHGVDWIDIFTAAVLFAEAWEHYHVTHHVKRPTIALGIALLSIGLLHGRILRRSEKRRSLRVDEEGLYVGGKPFRSLHAKWGEIAAIDVAERWGTITLKNGRVRKLDLPDLEGSHHVRAALAAAQQRLTP
jgi:hypothetical protein